MEPAIIALAKQQACYFALALLKTQGLRGLNIHNMSVDWFETTETGWRAVVITDILVGSQYEVIHNDELDQAEVTIYQRYKSKIITDDFIHLTDITKDSI